MINEYFYPSNLLPAAPVQHGYKNFWIRDGWYVGNGFGGEIKERLWKGMINVLDDYKWKLEIHAKKAPVQWFEHLHIRYSPDGKEIDEHWMHNQFDAHANWGEVALDVSRLDLASLMVDYLNVQNFHRKPAAGAWEDRNTCDAYSLASCIHFLQRAKKFLPAKENQIDYMVRQAVRRLYSLLPYATGSKTICLSLLGIIWPFDLAGPYKDDIISLVCSELQREPFGFIRYPGDLYDGEGFSRGRGNEVPWILGDLFMAKIQPDKKKWIDRLNRAYQCFGCMPEAYFPETMTVNRNTPLLWAEAMWSSLK